jgi:hypothetical protein
MDSTVALTCHTIVGKVAVALSSRVGANSSTIVNDATPRTAPDHTATSPTASAAQRGLADWSLAATIPPRDDTDGSSLAPFHPLLLSSTYERDAMAVALKMAILTHTALWASSQTRHVPSHD